MAKKTGKGRGAKGRSAKKYGGKGTI